MKKAESSSLFLSRSDAMQLSRKVTGLPVADDDFRLLINFGVLPNFGTAHDPLILDDHARKLTGKFATPIEISFAAMRASGMPRETDFDDHELLVLSPHLAVSFHPEQVAGTSIQAFVRLLRSHPDNLPTSGEWSETVTMIHRGLYVWAGESSKKQAWQTAWALADTRNARTSTAESLCVPMFFGSKSRISQFVVSTIRQNLEDGASICDLMCGTGLITRHLLPYFNVHANDAALFASQLGRSQAVDMQSSEAETIVKRLQPYFEANLSTLTELFGTAFDVESQFLLGNFSKDRLEQYRDFTQRCTRFLPDYSPSNNSTAWPDDLDAPVRKEVSALVSRCKLDPKSKPYVQAAAYWGNCYFGIKQAAEADSLRYAIEQVADDRNRPLLEAIFMATLSACASGPHFAQPPVAEEEPQLRQLLEKRAKALLPEFQLRLSLACTRPTLPQRALTVSNLPWEKALAVFAAAHAGKQSKGVYVDPPYTRFQYSRYYHLFDTMLRYDYPACERMGRTSESAKRFSSGFDRRAVTVVEEFKALFSAVKNHDCKLFLSYSTGGTVPIENLITMAQTYFKDVQIYAAPLQHHSQGVALQDRGRRMEIMIVATP